MEIIHLNASKKHGANNAAASIFLLSSAMIMASACGCAHRKELPTADLPDDAEIESLQASMFKSELGFNGIPEFTVLPQAVPGLMAWLRPNTYEKVPPILRDAIVGRLTIKTRQGKMVTVTIYSGGHNPPLFTTNGEDFFFGGGSISEYGRGVDGGVRMGKAIERAYEDRAR